MKKNIRKIIRDYGEYIKSYPKPLRFLLNLKAYTFEDVKRAGTKYLLKRLGESDFEIFQPDHPVPQ